MTGVDVLVVFGSVSDKRVYGRLMENLDNAKLEICSAHRNPEKLCKLISETDAKVIIGGAGLAAALPGVIASHTTKPVIGIPVAANLSGLDALLSIVQMPPRVPVIAVGVENSELAASEAKKMLKEYRGINIIENEKFREKVDKAKKIVKDFGVELSSGKEPKQDFININFVDLRSSFNVKENEMLTINVPMLENSKQENAVELMEVMKKGLWVGLNRAENAALAAVEILYSEYSEKLKGFRLK